MWRAGALPAMWVGSGGVWWLVAGFGVCLAARWVRRALAAGGWWLLASAVELGAALERRSDECCPVAV